MVQESSLPGQKVAHLRADKNTALEIVPAGKRYSRPGAPRLGYGAPLSRGSRPGLAPYASAPGLLCICARLSFLATILLAHRFAAMQQGQPRATGLAMTVLN